jgi:hypothetical protein
MMRPWPTKGAVVPKTNKNKTTHYLFAQVKILLTIDVTFSVLFGRDKRFQVFECVAALWVRW